MTVLPESAQEPTRFVRKTVPFRQSTLSVSRSRCSESAKVPAISKPNLEPQATHYRRAQYNRLIGEDIAQDMQCHCDDLPRQEDLRLLDDLLSQFCPVHKEKNETQNRFFALLVSEPDVGRPPVSIYVS
jgi:hypothetical protein